MQPVQARIRRERFGHLSAPLPGMSGRQARAGLLNSFPASSFLSTNSSPAGQRDATEVPPLGTIRSLAYSSPGIKEELHLRVSSDYPQHLSPQIARLAENAQDRQHG